jgi:putative sterol carrier protein
VAAADEVRAFFDGLAARFHADRAAGLDATFAFVIEGAGAWHAVVAEDACAIHEGGQPSADVTITCSAADWAQLVDGRLDPQFAFMTGRLQVEGDMSLAMRFRSLFL